MQVARLKVKYAAALAREAELGEALMRVAVSAGVRGGLPASTLRGLQETRTPILHTPERKGRKGRKSGGGEGRGPGCGGGEEEGGSRSPPRIGGIGEALLRAAAAEPPPLGA